MKLGGLVLDESSGDVSSTKLWLHIGNAVATVAFANVAWRATPSDSLASLFAVYLGLVAGSQLASKIIGLRYGVPAATNGTTAAPSAPGGKA